MQPSELKQWREAHQWNQTQAARYLGTTQVNVSRWERGTHAIPDSIELLAHLLSQKRNQLSVEKFLYKSLDT